ncbi:MAG: Gfo/Idh/MocA family oxidoreductase [Oscillospiraceae bacterium]|nr:Gfo/Idh/MocA family oxidoreductase [Oscillospiraceae bacterium]
MRYAILGFGGLGKLHTVNLELLKKEYDLTLAAVCATDPSRVRQNVSLNLGDVDISGLDFSSIAIYTDYKTLIDEVAPDFVISTLPTYLHAEAAIYALSRGIHVFSEKPMALTLEDCASMADAAKKSCAHLLIGQCLRFDPTMQYLKNCVAEETYGRCYRAEFHRYSQTPLWTKNNWILDPAQSGGCIFDMHIHDTDLINWMFGMPHSLTSAMTKAKVESESIFTQYRYENLLVTSAADWSLTQTFPFESRALLCCEHAVLDAKNGVLTVYQDDKVLTPEIPSGDYFMREMQAFLDTVTNRASAPFSPDDVLNSTRLAMLEIKSAESALPVIL